VEVEHDPAVGWPAAAGWEMFVVQPPNVSAWKGLLVGTARDLDSRPTPLTIAVAWKRETALGGRRRGAEERREFSTRID
jgi:hypothetical protein